MKMFIWGILLFLINLFIVFQNYSKGFTMPTSFFIESNQLMAFLVGIVYSQQSRKFDKKHILGVLSNASIFAILMTTVFGVYGVQVSFIFTILLAVSTFLCIFSSYALYYWLFCPDKFKKKHVISNKSRMKSNIK